MKLTESILGSNREIHGAKWLKTCMKRWRFDLWRESSYRNGIGMSVLLSPREPLDDLGYKMSRYPGFAVADGLDRFGEKRVAVFCF